MRQPFHFNLEALGFRRAQDVGRLFVLCALVGVVAGVGAIAFFYLLEAAKHLFLDSLAGFRPPGPLGELSPFGETVQPLSRWILFFMPAAGGLLSGLIVYSLAPEAEGHGTDAAIDSFHHHGGVIRGRVPLIKMIASAITIGTGGSAGREGPIAQIGAGFGAILAQWLKLPSRERRILMVAGMGAGIGAIFRAPLAGALFSAEVLYREMDLEHEVIVPAIFSSIVAFSVFSFAFSTRPLFVTPAFAFGDPGELAAYTVLALAVSLGALIYVRVFYGIRDLFQNLRLPRALKPALGGMMVGAIGLLVPQALCTGFGVLQGAFTGQFTIGMLFAVAGAKILTTSFTVATGGSGGVFGPAVVIGGSLGGGMGLVFERWFFGLVPTAGTFAMVGMAGFFAAAANTPISTVIMVSEMTGNYHLLVPSMWVCLIGFLLVRSQTIYENQVPSRMDSPVHAREMIRMIMSRLCVGDALKMRPAHPVHAISESLSLAEVRERFSEIDSTCLPVVDAQGLLTGQVTLEMVQQTLGQQPSELPLIAKDLALPPATVTREHSLYDALHQMVSGGFHELLVVEAKNGKEVADILSAADINVVFEHQMEESGLDGDAPFTHSVFRKWLKEIGAPRS